MNEKSLRNETYILLMEKEEMNVKKTEDDFYHFCSEKTAICKSKL